MRILTLSCALALTTPLLWGQAPTVTGVFNAASLDTRLAPGAAATVFGANLGPAPVTVQVGGKAAHIINAIANQLNVQLPFDLATGSTTLIVQRGGQSSAPFSIVVDAHAPALYANQNIAFANRQNGSLVTAANLPGPGEPIWIYANGLGATNPAVASGMAPPPGAVPATTSTVTLTVGGRSVTPTFAGLSPGAVGLYQVNFIVPTDLAEGNHPVILTIAGKTSNTVTLPIGRPVSLISRVVNGATFGSVGTIAAGQIASVFASNLGLTNKLNGFPATEFEGVSVTFNGTPAPLVHLVATAGQINLVTPSDLPETGNVAVVVRTAIGAGLTYTARMTTASPGIFRLSDPSNTSRANAAALFANTAWRVIPASMARAFGWPVDCKAAGVNAAADCGEEAVAGDNVQIYMTGLGKATPGGAAGGTPLATGAQAPVNADPLYLTVLRPTITVGGVPAVVQFSGIAPGFAGLYQVNFQIPVAAPTGNDVPVRIEMPNGATDSATIPIRAR